MRLTKQPLIKTTIRLIAILLCTFPMEGSAQKNQLWSIDINNSRVLLDSLNNNHLSTSDTMRFKFDVFNTYTSTYDSKLDNYILECDTAILIFNKNGTLRKTIHKTLDIEGMEYNPEDEMVYCVAMKNNSYYFARIDLKMGNMNLLRSLSDNSMGNSTLDYENGFYYIVSDSKGLFKIDIKTGRKLDSIKYFTTNNCNCNVFDIETGVIATTCNVGGKKTMQLFNPATKTFTTLDTIEKYGTGYFGYNSASFDQQTGNWYLNLGKAIGIKNVRTNKRMDTLFAPFNRIKNIEFPGKACYNALSIQQSAIRSPLCFAGSDGEIQLKIKGGRPPYYYNIDSNNYDTFASFKNLKSGRFKIHIKDHNDLCQLTTEYTLQSVLPFSNLIKIEHNKCYHNQEGRITVMTNGATPPYRYTLNNGTFTSDSLFNNLRSGNYNITILDSNNCADSIKNIAVNAPPPIKMDSLIIRELKCAGNRDGELHLKISGGIPPYRIKTDEYDSILGNSIKNLGPGKHSLKITDSNFCQLDSNFSLTEPLPYHCSTTIRNSQCFGENNGVVRLKINGGSSADQYSLKDLKNGIRTPFIDSIKGLKPDTYHYLLENQNGCTDSLWFQITEPPIFKIHKIKDTTICNGQLVKYKLSNNNAMSYKTVSDNGLSFATDTLLLQTAGTYITEIRNQNNCSSRDTFTVQKINLNVMHDFLMPSAAFLSDTIYAVNISRPEAESKHWQINNNRYNLFEKDAFTSGFHFSDTGSYNITLHSTYKACGYELTKAINIYSNHDSLTVDERFGYRGPLIQQFEIFSNPHDGQHFTIKIVLRDSAEANLYKIDATTGAIAAELNLGKKKTQQLTVFTSLKSEVYYLKLIVGRESRVIKVVAVM